MKEEAAMKVYVENENINVVQTVASSSTMLGSLASIAKRYIISKFPKNYFKHIYIDTAETLIEQDRNSKFDPTANKIPYPSLTITPEISLDDPISMDRGLHTASPNLYLRKDVGRNYRKLVVDPDNNFSIVYTADYITTNFNFRITTDSFIKSSDIAFFLKSKFQKDFFLFLNNEYIQTEIPKSFIKMIADIKNLDLNDATDMDTLRLYLIGTSRQPETIQKRINLSTGQQCFFINDKENILTLMTDLDCPSSISRNSQIEDEYAITFRLQMSCYLSNAFILSISKQTLKKLELRTVQSLESEENQMEDGLIALDFSRPVIGKKTVLNFLDNQGIEQIGHLIYNDIFTYNLNEPIPKIYLMGALPEEFKKIHSYGKNILHLDLSSLVYIYINSVNGKISEDDYYLNYDEMSIEISNGITNDVSIAIYLNRLLYETIKKAMQDDKNFIDSNYLTTVIANISGETKNIIVKSFKNSNELNNSNLETLLRINTIYGIGYISLLQDDSKDGYKICIGFDKDNKPIVKKLEIE